VVTRRKTVIPPHSGSYTLLHSIQQTATHVFTASLHQLYTIIRGRLTATPIDPDGIHADGTVP